MRSVRLFKSRLTGAIERCDKGGLHLPYSKVASPSRVMVRDHCIKCGKVLRDAL